MSRISIAQTEENTKSLSIQDALAEANDEIDLPSTEPRTSLYAGFIGFSERRPYRYAIRHRRLSLSACSTHDYSQSGSCHLRPATTAPGLLLSQARYGEDQNKDPFMSFQDCLPLLSGFTRCRTRTRAQPRIGINRLLNQPKQELLP